MAGEEIIDSLKTDWTPADFYNFEDLNRVESATRVVRDKIAEFKGVLLNDLQFVENRTELDIEFADGLNRIENNILALSETFGDIRDIVITKTDWTFNVPFDFNDANRLESSLSFMYNNIEANLSNIPYCGQYTVGQEGVY